jgi:beta-phosphoglucomutase family hydrolase
MKNKEIAVIFDMDGVIVDNDVYHFRAWGELCKNYGLNVSPEVVKSWFGNTNHMILRNLFGDTVDDKQVVNMGNEKEILYREIYKNDIKALPGLENFLVDLEQNDIIIAIATSAPTVNVDFVLKNTGLRKYFDHIIDASMIKEGKPSPEIYLKSSEVIKLDVSDCLVFEDSFHGIESARRAGMKVIGVATTHAANELKGTIKNINDFTKIIAKEVIQIIKTT